MIMSLEPSIGIPSGSPLTNTPSALLVFGINDNVVRAISWDT